MDARIAGTNRRACSHAFGFPAPLLLAAVVGIEQPLAQPDRFRGALGALPTGVTVVTASGPNGPSGATAHAVTSL